MKPCTKCGAVKPLDAFYHREGSDDGRAYHCKACSQAAARLRYATKRKEIAQKVRTYDDAHVGTYLWRIAKRRADRKGVPFTITPGDVDVPTHCPVLGCRLERGRRKGETDSSPTIDRLVPALGYTPGNIRVISGRANRLKADATTEEVRKLLNWLEHQEASGD